MINKAPVPPPKIFVNDGGTKRLIENFDQEMIHQDGVITAQLGTIPKCSTISLTP